MADRHMTLVEHLDELRYRILISLAAIAIGTSIAFWKIKPIVAYLAKPVGHLVFLSPTEAFMAYFKLAFFVGLFLASPVILFQIWGFVSSALKEKEQKVFLFFLPFSVILFLCGAALAFFIVIPLALKFFINFAGPEVLPVISISEYLSFITILTLIFGAVFELPVAIIILSKLGLVTPAFLSKNRKWAILIIFLAAAALTPTPDAFTQMLMAIPMILLYEISIWVSRLVYVKREEIKDDA
ncbi:MAG: twin-arginine translocase subunit TatC [Candidatus Omnitrophota bacterium]|nr:twin-arginine translocase subunit TatC [Candidatus Omnitrophota bacterium]